MVEVIRVVRVVEVVRLVEVSRSINMVILEIYQALLWCVI